MTTNTTTTTYDPTDTNDIIWNAQGNVESNAFTKTVDTYSDNVLINSLVEHGLTTYLPGESLYPDAGGNTTPLDFTALLGGHEAMASSISNLNSTANVTVVNGMTEAQIQGALAGHDESAIIIDTGHIHGAGLNNQFGYPIGGDGANVHVFSVNASDHVSLIGVFTTAIGVEHFVLA